MPRLPKPSADSTNKSQLTPDDWIDAATALLVNKSIDAVRVEVLSKDLGVSRGSFYWHFRDRDDLLRQLLVRWRDRATEQIIDDFERRNMPPKELLRDLTKLPFRGDTARAASAVELAIRAWARRDDMARQFVDEVDHKPLSYIAQCFSALGHAIAEARNRAFVLYAYEISEGLLANQGTAEQREQRRAFVEQLLMHAPP